MKVDVSLPHLCLSPMFVFHFAASSKLVKCHYDISLVNGYFVFRLGLHRTEDCV